MLSFATLLVCLAGAPDLRLHDAFDRDVTRRGITLVDWEGQIANPAVRLRLELPPETRFPAEVHIHGSSSRIHFDRESPEDRSGVGRRMRLPDASASTEFFVTIFPDRDTEDERHELMIQLIAPGAPERRLSVPVRVIDQDLPPQPALYPILLEYGEDRTGWFDAPEVREVLRQVADDWAYFLGDQEIDPTPAGDEVTLIWNADGFVTTRRVTNERGYTGYLIYVSGVVHDEMRAGGSPSLRGRPQTSRGRPTPLRRSGTLNFDVRGNWNLLGWVLSTDDEAWWVSGNLRNEPSDFYSIALHEMGHALAFESTFPLMGRARDGDGLYEARLVEYLGQAPSINDSHHFPGVIDPVSQYGGFGMEYLGRIKARRWLITKSHLLSLQAVGYKLRPTSAFASLAVESPGPARFQVGESSEWTPAISGGVPDYCARVVEGALPEGMHLDSFTGTLTGVPREPGSFPIRLEINDQDPTTPPQALAVTIVVEE